MPFRLLLIGLLLAKLLSAKTMARTLTQADAQDVYLNDYCNSTTINDAIRLSKEQSLVIKASKENYRNDVDCLLRVIPTTGCGLIIDVQNVNLRQENTNKDYLKMTVDSQVHWWLGASGDPMSHFTTLNQISIEFSSSGHFTTTEGHGLTIIITAYKESAFVEQVRVCPDDHLPCGQLNLCVHEEHYCSIDACRDGHPIICQGYRLGDSDDDDYDEDSTPVGLVLLSQIIGSLLVVGLLLVIVACICRMFCWSNANDRRLRQYLDNVNVYHKYPGRLVRVQHPADVRPLLARGSSRNYGSDRLLV